MIKGIMTRTVLGLVLGVVGCAGQSNDGKNESLDERASSITTRDIVILNIEDYSSDELKPLLDKIYEVKPRVIGLNFYYKRSIIKPTTGDVISLEDIIPFEMADGYLLKIPNLKSDFQESVVQFNPYHIVELNKVNSFAVQVSHVVDKNASVNSENIVYAGNWEVFSVCDVPYALSNLEIFRNKIVLVGYVGTIAPDPAMLDEIDADVYLTPIGLMYETVIQANIISTILNLKKP